MAQQQNDEIDLGYILDKINGVFQNIAIGIYNGIQFLFRNWYIVLGLLIAGVLLGYFSDRNYSTLKTSDVILKTNFNTKDYTYDALNALLLKSKEKDSAFLVMNGFRGDSIEIRNIEIKPIINFKDISENYNSEQRLILESILRNVEFEEEETIPESLIANYKMHMLNVIMADHASQNTIDAIFTYLNNNEHIKKLSQVGKENIQSTIEKNDFTIKNIDATIANYGKAASLPSINSQLYVVDKNFSYHGIIIEKAKINERNIKLKENLIYANQAIIKVNDAIIVETERSLRSRKMLLYPFAFLFLFILGTWLLTIYRKIKALAEANYQK